MKKFLFSLLAMMLSLVANAQEAEVTITVALGDTKDPTCIPVEFSLDNNINISCIGGFIKHPVGSRFVDPEDPTDEEMIDCTKESARCVKNHQLDFAEDDLENGKLQFAFLSRKNDPFKGNTGKVFSLYIDCSKLSDGDYSLIPMKIEGVDTEYNSYIKEEESAPIEFTMKGGNVVTGINITSADETSGIKDGKYLQNGKVVIRLKGKKFSSDGMMIE